MAFDFVSEKDAIPEEAETLTGHADGQVTINASEADPVERTKMQQDMDESYRTLLGHFRHEVGHYYWDRLIGTSDEWTQEFRALFGDESASYADALQRHYESGPRPIGHSSLSAHTRHHTHGKTGQKPGRTISIVSTRWKRQSLLVSRSIRRKGQDLR